ncbi:uncharacterized protein [Macrobrachium rosenbergii]|uniref:uncharacterized protein n=1 Tax=Macrobrachium rosenbergii TaxID=79674 RepID=UPI0034D4FF24
MKLAVALVVMVVVSVDAHPGKHDRPCNADTPECRCRKLTKPPKDAEEGKGGPMGEAISACEQELTTQVPVGRGRGRGPHEHPLEQMSDEFKSCVKDKLLSTLGFVDGSGKVNATAVESKLAEMLNANKGSDVSDAQVQTIVSEVPRCITEAGGDNLELRDFHHCMKDACATALSA